MGWLRFSVARLMTVVVTVAIGFTALRTASEPWAGTMLLLTFGALFTATLGAVYSREARRAARLGFALFGWGYMILNTGVWWNSGRPVLVTTMVLEHLYPRLQSDRGPLMLSSILLSGSSAEDRRILQKLERPIPIPFPEETPLEEVLKYIKAATVRGPNDKGIPIYVDPVGLELAEKTMQSPVQLDLEGIPLKTTLRLILKQLGLVYIVQDGILKITAGSIAGDATEAYRLIGQCCWALLSACLGAMTGCLLYASRDRGLALHR